MFEKEMDELMVNPNPRLVALLNFALDEITGRLDRKGEYDDWLSWASSWKDGRRQPQSCVNVAHRCFEHGSDPVWHCLGQLAWGAKEACYSTPKAGWLVVRYIADAMDAFGVAFPDKPLPLLDRPTIDETATAHEQLIEVA